MTKFVVTQTQTIAQQVGALFRNEGDCFTAADGRNLFAVIAEQRSANSSKGNTERYEFDDESALLANGDVWDYESGDEYYVMQSEVS